MTEYLHIHVPAYVYMLAPYSIKLAVRKVNVSSNNNEREERRDRDRLEDKNECTRGRVLMAITSFFGGHLPSLRRTYMDGNLI